MQNAAYWFGTEYAPYPVHAWLFTNFGQQSNRNKNDPIYAWAVRSGDVGGTGTVPEPDMIWLFGAGALAWSGARTRRRG